VDTKLLMMMMMKKEGS